jgi:hypothetical protein
MIGFVTKIGEKHKYAKPSAIQVKNRQKTIGSEEKLDVISELEKGERIVHICHNVRLSHTSVHTIVQFVIMLVKLTLSLLMSYIYGAPSKARNLTCIYIYIWMRFLYWGFCFLNCAFH